MDEPSPPTAAELGISEVEYDRIMRDMRRRGQVAPLPDPPAPPAGRRISKWLALVAAALLGITTLLTALGPTDHGPAYAFMETVEGQPVTYSSCGTIQVAVYPAGGPANAEELVRDAVAQVRTATGLDIVVAGVFGGHAPNWNFEVGPVYPDDPISVSWQDGDAIAQITDDIAGVGGSRVMSGPRGSKRLVAGTIALSRDYYRQLAAHQDESEELAVLLHEFGHVFGLDHVDSSGELMYHRNIGRKSYGPGDLEGLRRVGHGPCT